MQPVGRILSKKQRKRLEKIVDVKKKKENRAQLLKVNTTAKMILVPWYPRSRLRSFAPHL